MLGDVCGGVVQAHFSPRGAGALGASLGAPQQQNSFEPAAAMASALAAAQYNGIQQQQVPGLASHPCTAVP